MRLTVWLLKVAMTLSAPSLVSKTISAMTRGCVLTRRHDTTGPLCGVMALSMSAAVVPGAKFCAITTYGPASPRIDIPLLRGAVGIAIAAAGITLATCSVDLESALANLATLFTFPRLEPRGWLTAAAAGRLPGAWIRAARELGFSWLWARKLGVDRLVCKS
jgi:hypothetical protein